MADVLLTKSTHGFAPLRHGNVTLAVVDYETIWSVSAFAGTEVMVMKALNLPKIGKASGGAVWAGHRHWLLRDCPRPKPRKGAAITDQFGGWIVFGLTGDGTTDVLARLCPLDLREKAFSVGDTARTEFAHMMALVTRTDTGFEVWIMRSFAQTAHHHIADAMKSVAAQRLP